MVGGPNFETKPFNLATLGHRQPGSSIKPFTLVTALEEGISPVHRLRIGAADLPLRQARPGSLRQSTTTKTPTSAPATSSARRPTRTTRSTPQLALEGAEGQERPRPTSSIAATIHKMGYRGPISTNPAMVLGGLKEGVTPLDWTYAYMTLANNGDRVSGTLAPEPGDSPVAFTKVTDQDGNTIKGGDNDSTHQQVISEETADDGEEHPRNRGQQRHRDQRPRSAPQASGARPGRPRTTATPGSAARPTKSPPASGSATRTRSPRWTTLYNGGPVMGGTFPALIWASVISAWEEIAAERAAESASHRKPARRRRQGTLRRRRRIGNLRAAGGNRSRSGRTRRSRARSRKKPRPNRKRRRKKPRPRPKKPRPASGGTRRRHRRRLGAAAAAETKGLPAAQKRQGRSTALVMPIRGPVTTSGRPAVRRRRERERLAGEVGAVLARARCRAPRSACPGPSRGRRRGGACRRRARASPRGRRSARGRGSGPPPHLPPVRRRS